MSFTDFPFDIVHSDLWTSPVASSNGHRYYVLFLDDFSKFLWTFPISKKSQVYSLFTIFHSFVKTQFERPIKNLQCDNGKEFDNGPFQMFARQNGMQFRLSCPHTSSQNGKVERHIRSINNIVRTLLAHASMPPSFWHHTLSMATYLLNILPTKVLGSSSPTQLLYQKDPSYSHLRVFGCLCFPLFSSNTIHKLQERSTPCVFLGYPPDHRGYKCYDLSSRKIFVARHVLFDEHSFPFSKIHTPQPSTYDFLDNDVNPLYIHQMHQHKYFAPANQPTPTPTPTSQQTQTLSPARSPGPQPNPSQERCTPTSPLNAAKNLSQPSYHSPPSSSPVRPGPSSSPTAQSPTGRPSPNNPMHRCMTTRSQHGIFKPNPKYSTNLNTETTIPISPLPKNPVSALRDSNWKNAMIVECNALIENKTWELIPRPADVNVIRSMWIFRHKKKSNGSFERHKTRLVGDGRSQQKGVDCEETFSPVVKPASIRTILSIALSHSWPIHQLDVKNAFLRGNLTETVYMHQPLGFKDPNFPDHVCLLNKSLYGLKQAPRAWCQRFVDFVATIGFSHSKSDYSLFIYRRGSDIAYILIYVDDIILTVYSDTIRQTIMALLSAEFAMKDLGPLSYFLGIAVTRNTDGLFLSQKQYAEEILERAELKTNQASAAPSVKAFEAPAVVNLRPPPIERHKSFDEDDIAAKPIVPPKKVDTSKINARQYSIADLQMATDSFSVDNLIGEGSFGRVYRAQFDDGKVLAVKKINSSALQNPEDFLDIVSEISRLHHPNVIELVGYCSEHGQHLLVYEFHKNGSLHEFLHLSDEESKPLTWNSRVKIALGTARALEYLHEVYSPSLVHNNIESANILLDAELNPHLSDSGLASLIADADQALNHNTGSGYGAPEVAMSGQFTIKSDVYSFGVVMLELLTGRKPFDSARTRSEQSLVRWATPQLHDIDALAKMVDPALEGLYPVKSLSRFADVIALCVQPEPEFRPPMSEVVEALVRLVQRANMSKRTVGARGETDAQDYEP